MNYQLPPILIQIAILLSLSVNYANYQHNLDRSPKELPPRNSSIAQLPENQAQQTCPKPQQSREHPHG